MADHAVGPLMGTLYVTPVEAFDTLVVEPSAYSGTPTLDSANNRISVLLKGGYNIYNFCYWLLNSNFRLT